MIRTPYRYRSKPTPGARLDHTGPLAAQAGGWWSFLEGGGPLVGDQSPGANHLTTVGAPAWTATVGGLAMGSFGTTAYLKNDAAAGAFGTAPPWWFVGLAIIPSGNVQTGTLLSLAWSTNSTANRVEIQVTTGTTPVYNVRDSAGVNATVTGAAGTWNDGKPHLYHGRSLSTKDHRLAIDGIQVASGTTTIGAIAPTQFTVGASRTNSTVNAWRGQVLAVVGGPGMGPDPMDLQLNLWSAFATPWMARFAVAAVAAAGPAAARCPIDDVLPMCFEG